MSNLSDNTEVIKTKVVPDDIVCKDCENRIGITTQSNNYHKVSCAIYEYPVMKPMGILLRNESCENYSKEEK